ncbi:fungal specific transcription factor domain-containing protein [Aspergillus foveolatus]|uniref:fungal specific transcription factor domain-containing protein n=1 Tax=Aspergillus foveolatus TaxID=210207 RepID=UPI003CCD46FC
MVVSWEAGAAIVYTELNYACQYERTVKKRGPKPRSQTSNHQSKRSANAGMRARTYPSPVSTASGKGPPDIDRASLCAKSDRDGNGSCPNTPVRADGLCSSANVQDDHLYLDKATIQGSATRIPNCSYFPLNLSSVAMSSTKVYSIPSCRYSCLNPVLPLLQGTMTAEDACKLLDIYFADSETGGSISGCPYVLSPIIRVQSLLRETNPRPVSPALLMIILWCVSHTANLGIFPDSSTRLRVTQRLYFLSMKLLRARVCETWHQAADEWLPLSDMPLYGTSVDTSPSAVCDGKVEQGVDDVLSYVLLTCVVSATEFKDECLKWWNRAVRLVKRLGFHSEARIAENTPSRQQMSLTAREEHEERRRVFWLVYSLDRHLALSFNEPLHILDPECQVLCPLPERVWQNLDQIPLEDIPPRIFGPPTYITGTTFFEYFLPLMAILGDIIELRSRNQHPRLGGFDRSYLTGTIEAALADCEYSLHILQAVQGPTNICSNELSMLAYSPTFSDSASRASLTKTELRRVEVAVAYGQYLIQVLHILLHRGWDPATVGLVDASCAPLAYTAHSVAAGDAIKQILNLDQDLSFIPFVFGTYLFHGSLDFLSVVNQIGQVGAIDLAKQGCGAVLRAHEVALKTLDTSFQARDLSIIKCPQES